MTPAVPSNSITAPAAHEPQAGPTAPLDAPAVPVSLDEHRRHMMAALRHVEAIRDELIDQLDQIAGDPDLEDTGDDEPTLGAPETLGGFASIKQGRMDQRRWVDGYHGHDDEREVDPDYEPSLGSVGQGNDRFDQHYWNGLCSDSTDLEGDASLSEGSLGWPEALDQSRLGAGSEELEYDLGAPNPSGRMDQTHWGERNEGWGGGDAEQQCEDEGAQCDDEGHDSDREPSSDDEGDAQAPCHSSTNPASPWPPVGTVAEQWRLLDEQLKTDPIFLKHLSEFQNGDAATAGGLVSRYYGRGADPNGWMTRERRARELDRAIPDDVASPPKPQLIEVSVNFQNAPQGTIATAKVSTGAKINLRIGHAMPSGHG